MEDKLLIYKCKRGSRKALGRIYEKYKADMVLLAITLLNDTAAAEDVAHDVFLAFVNNLETFRLTGSLRSFLMTCVANKAKDNLKARRVRLSDPGANKIDMSKDPLGPIDHVLCNEQVERLAAATKQLPYEQREIVMLRLQGNITFAAIADTLGIPSNTVRSRYRYGLEKLRLLLENEVEQ
ncbi:MAG: RNA polymerase sigma factor [Phycisphaeraceae bacterium]|nr:RNA polymerase sigma factor [Phycisphaeraceae bacterium]